MGAAQTHNDRIVIVIPTLDEAANLETVVRSLARGKALLLELEIVVADGGSCDGTAAIATRLAAEMPFVHLVHNPRRNQSAAVNLAAGQWAARADVMIRCDAHAIYPDFYVERLVQTLNATGAASVVVCMDSLGQTCFQKAVAWVCDTWIGSGGAAHRAGHASGFVDHGHHAAFRLPAFLAAGGYDESFSYNEDAELDCRLVAAGQSIYLDAGIRIGYQPRANAAALWWQYFHYGQGRSRTMRKHPGRARLRQLAVPLNLVLLIMSPLVAIANDRWWCLAWPAAYLTILALVSLYLAARKRSLCGLLAGPAAAVMHTAWACGFLYGLLFIRERAWKPHFDLGHAGQAIRRNSFD